MAIISQIYTTEHKSWSTNLGWQTRYGMLINHDVEDDVDLLCCIYANSLPDTHEKLVGGSNDAGVIKRINSMIRWMSLSTDVEFDADDVFIKYIIW